MNETFTVQLTMEQWDTVVAALDSGMYRTEGTALYERYLAVQDAIRRQL